MRIIASADIHGVMTVYQWLADQTEQQGAGLLLLAGDLMDVDSEEEQRKQARNIIALLRTLRIPVFYIMGNDDFVALDYEDEQIKPINCRGIEHGGYNFVGYQYSLPFIGGIHTKIESEIANDLVKLEPLVDDRTVFVSHSPGWGLLDRTGSGVHAGSRSLSEWMRRKPPLAHVHGHVHNQFGRDGIHFNVASAATKRAICFEVPSLIHQVISS